MPQERYSSNIVKVQNCPDIIILNSLFGFVCLSFCLDITLIKCLLKVWSLKSHALWGSFSMYNYDEHCAKKTETTNFYKVSSDDSIVHSSWLISPIIIMVIMIEKPKYKTEKSWQMTEMRSEEIFWAAPLSGWRSLTKYYRRKTLQQHKRNVLESVFSGRELTFVNAFIFTYFHLTKTQVRCSGVSFQWMEINCC